MKRQIRRGVFETNSSSTHSLTMCSRDTYSKWERGEVYRHSWRENFKTALRKKSEVFLFFFHLCPNSNCSNFSIPLTAILEPNGGLVKTISKEPNLISF